MDGSLPTEFRIFASGWNGTTKGRFLFDEAAAASVMADYAEHGADVMIDLEHLSLESPEESRNFDPDARGWCRLELRGGELWAVDVRWTPDGAQRLAERRQRYISPAFEVDPETKRVRRIVNNAITALPATHGLTPLVAAADRGAGSMEQLLAALGLEASASMDEVLAAIGDLKSKLDEALAPKSEEPPADEAMADKPEEDPEQMAVVARLSRLTGKVVAADALDEVEAWHKSHVELAQQREKLAQERAALEAGKRRALVVEMVKCGAETPATAWDDDEAKTLAEPWASMPIEKLEARVAKLRAAGAKPHELKPKKSGEVQLSERELAMCAQMKIDPAVYAAKKKKG